MAKVSTKSITSIDADWGNDGTGLPYSGQAVLTFIKEELKTKVTQEEVVSTVSSLLNSSVFQDGEGSIVTNIEQQGAGIVVTQMNSAGTTTTTPMDFSKEDPNARVIQIAVQTDKQAINVGGTIEGNFGFIIRQGGLILDGVGANVTLRLTRLGSATPFYTTSLGYIQASTNESEIITNTIPDLTTILQRNVSDNATVVISIAVAHTYTYEEEGLTITKTVNLTGTTRVTVINLTLKVDSGIIVNLGMTGQVSIPYRLSGNGTKSVFLYKNGKMEDSHLGKEGVNISDSFVLNSIPDGLTNFLIVAQSNQGDTTVYSSSFYFDLFKSVAGTVIALFVEDFTGTIQGEENYKLPAFAAAKFADFQLTYYAFNPTSTSLDATVLTEELDADYKPISSTSLELKLNRQGYIYSKKIKTSNTIRIKISADGKTREIYINPLTSSINIELPAEALLLNLDADGRSNNETTPAVWTYGDVSTLFEGVNWQSNGWVIDEGGAALLLLNGAKATINFPLFLAQNGDPVTRTGCTFEILFKCSNATLEENDVISCYWKNNSDKLTGLHVTTTYAGVNTGEVTKYYDDDGNETLSTETRVGTQYALNNYYKFTFVIDPKAPSTGSTDGLCYAYINGILSFIAPAPSSFINLENLPIVIDSANADVYIKSIKYYGVPFTHNQCVDSFIIDQSTSAEIEDIYQENQVLAKDAVDNEYVSPKLLHDKGRGVLIITGYDATNKRNIIDTLNRSSDKKSYFGPVRVDYFAPKTDLNLGTTTIPTKGNPFNFTHKECAIRIQGTTSTKRPRKNWRLHFNKKNKEEKPSKGSFWVGGKQLDSFKYAMSQGAVEVPIACLKVDYVDSSMTHNTGGAVIFNEITRYTPILRNPAQQREYVNSATDIKTRVAIEGFPIDVFQADDITDAIRDRNYLDDLDDSYYTNLKYIGQYNFNNDKSKSGKVFGFDGSYTYDEDGTYNPEGAYQPICIEFLDNYADLDLFKVKFDTDGNIDEAATYGKFADALEVRAPEDVTDQIADYGLDSLITASGFENYRYVPTLIKRVFNFVGECAKEVALRNGRSAVSLNTMTSDELESMDWTSPKFTNEAENYLQMDSICAWYIWTDYTIAVDQRAKNMMLYTMNGSNWGLQYYDGDTLFGERNDCFLAYDYLTDRNTYDYGVGQYAFQGHDSWLWYLVRANFDERLISVCRAMQDSLKFSAAYFKSILNDQFVSNWSQRQYNYSQDYKYIQPLTETGFGGDIGTDYTNTAQGSREAHRTYTIENRFNLLDSKYKTTSYASDAFSYVGGTGVDNVLTIKSSIPFYFGWLTTGQNIANLHQHTLADASNNYTVLLTIRDNGANNMALVLGASRIKELTFAPNSIWDCTTQGKSISLKSLLKLVAHDVRGTGTPNFTGSSLLTYLDLRNSGFAGIEGINNCSKLRYIDVRGTDIPSVRFADGSPLEDIKLGSPEGIYLSNLNGIVFNDTTEDTLTVEDWTNLSELLINECPQVDWEKLVAKLVASSARNKFLRITGIDKQADLTWLDQFDGFYGLNANGGQITTSALLQGVLRLNDYTDDELVEQYRAKYGNNGLLTIMQPEYTIIEMDETITDERAFASTIAGNITNLDNNTGARNSTQYVPSGHITNILRRCHRYLGKLVSKGNTVLIPANPNDPTRQFLKGRDKAGTMYIIQLEDKDSRYFAEGYNSSITRRQADLSGTKSSKHGEVYLFVPGFWYKGINFLSPTAISFSRKYTCFSSQEQKPSISSETRVLKVADLKAVEALGDNDEGLYKENRILSNTNAANNVQDRISATANTSYDIIRVDVSGYKKVRYPLSVGQTCCLFTDTEGKIMTNVAGAVAGVGELYISTSTYAYNGMPAIATIPAGSKWFYIAVPKYVRNKITTDPCDIVLHKGSKFTSGDQMSAENAKDWIADMEPDWVYSEPTCIAAAEAASDDSLTLYTSFNGSKTAAVGSGSTDVPDLNIKGQWFQHSMSEAAYDRGLQLIDYEGTKLLAMLFTAKYGRRNSQNVLGAGTSTTGRRLGATAQYGMTDTTIPPNIEVSETWSNAAIPSVSVNGQIVYTNVGIPVFLGVENIQGNVWEWMDRAFMANETEADCGKIRITNPDLSTRRVFGMGPSSSYPNSIVHGKYCDICSCSPAGGSTTTGYCDWQSFDSTLRTTWANTKALGRSDHHSGPGGGVFYLNSGVSVGFSYASGGSRLLFRGNIIETSDIDYYLGLAEIRES